MYIFVLSIVCTETAAVGWRWWFRYAGSSCRLHFKHSSSFTCQSEDKAAKMTVRITIYSFPGFYFVYFSHCSKMQRKRQASDAFIWTYKLTHW